MSQALQIKNEEYFNLLNFGDTLNYDLSLKNDQNNFLRTMVEYFHADNGQFCLHDHCETAAKKENTALVNISWRYTEQYIEYYHNLDPFLKVTPGVTACRDIDLSLPSHWKEIEFYTDFIKPQKIRHLLVMYLLDDNRILGHIGIHRNGSNAAFSQKELFQAGFLASTFSHKLKQKQLFHKLNGLDTLLQQLIEMPSVGIVALDYNLLPIYWNSLASDFGFSGSRAMETKGLIESRYLIFPEIRDECHKIRMSLQGKCITECINHHMVLWTYQEHPINVDIKVIPVRQSGSDATNQIYFVIVFNHLYKSDFSQEDVVPLNGTLTSKEIEIVHDICNGLTNKEISQKLFISLPTVATHISHIFQKMQVNSRAKLIHRLCQ